LQDGELIGAGLLWGGGFEKTPRMQIDRNQLFGAILCFLPAFFVIVHMIRRLKERKAGHRAPFTDLVRRPAGEELRLKLEQMEEQHTELALWLLMFPMLMAMCLFMAHPKDPVSPIVCFVISAVSSALIGIKLYRLVRKKSDYQLGYEGERFVGKNCPG